MGLGGIISGFTQLAGAFGNRHEAPTMVPYDEVDAQEEQQRAIAGNIAAQDDIERLLTRVNSYTQGEASRLLEMAIPGFGNLRKSLMGQAQQMADNPYALPDEVEQNLSRLAAERGINISGGRSQFGDFSALKDMGLNMLQYGQSRMNQSSSIAAMLAATAPRVNPMSPASFFVSPSQQIGLTIDNNTKRQGIQQMNENAIAGVNNWNNDRLWAGIQGAADTFWAAEQQTFQNAMQVAQLFMGGMGGMGGG